MLLKWGAEVNGADELCDLPIHRALGFGYGQIAAALVAAGARLTRADSDGASTLHLAVQGRCLDAVKLVLQQEELDVNVKEKSLGFTALHEAAQLDASESIEALLIAGAWLEARSNRGDTALHVAVKHSSKRAIHTLISHGADVHLVNERDESVCDLASAAGCLDVLEAELQLKVRRASTQRYRGTSSLHAAL
jgi:ankyrin repeat protein